MYKVTDVITIMNELFKSPDSDGFVIKSEGTTDTKTFVNTYTFFKEDLLYYGMLGDDSVRVNTLAGFDDNEDNTDVLRIQTLRSGIYYIPISSIIDISSMPKREEKKKKRGKPKKMEEDANNTVQGGTEGSEEDADFINGIIDNVPRDIDPSISLIEDVKSMEAGVLKILLSMSQVLPMMFDLYPKETKAVIIRTSILLKSYIDIFNEMLPK